MRHAAIYFLYEKALMNEVELLQLHSVVNEKPAGYCACNYAYV